MDERVAAVGGSLLQSSGRLQIGKRRGNDGPVGDRLESEWPVCGHICVIWIQAVTYTHIHMGSFLWQLSGPRDHDALPAINRLLIHWF